MCYMCIQYAIRSWMNEERAKLYNSSEDFSIVRTSTKVAKLFISNITYIITFIILLIEQTAIITTLVYFFAILPSNSNAFLITEYAGYASGIVHSAIFLASIIIIFIADFIIDVKKNKCCSGYYSRDILNYRVDATVWIVLLCILVLAYVLVELTAPESNYGVFVITALLNVAFRSCLVIAGGLSCVIVVINRFVKQKTMTSYPDGTESMTRSDLMKKVIAHPRGRVVFEAYCHSEMSTENIKAFFDLQKFSELRDADNKRQMTKTIYYKYIQPNATMEVNIPQPVKSKIRAAIEKLDSDGIVPENIFEDFEYEVVVNLTDTFSRFMLSEQYKKLRRRSSQSKVQYNALSGEDTSLPTSPMRLLPDTFSDPNTPTVLHVGSTLPVDDSESSPIDSTDVEVKPESV
jgi:hypothetical protein